MDLTVNSRFFLGPSLYTIVHVHMVSMRTGNQKPWRPANWIGCFWVLCKSALGGEGDASHRHWETLRNTTCIKLPRPIEITRVNVSRKPPQHYSSAPARSSAAAADRCPAGLNGERQWVETVPLNGSAPGSVC